MNELAVVQNQNHASVAIRPLSELPGLKRTIEVFLAKCEKDGIKFSVPSQHALTVDQRVYLEKRIEKIVNHVQPCGQSFIAQNFTVLRRAFPSRSVDIIEAKETTKLWAMTLADLPAFAIEQAMADYINGRTGSGFFPSLPEFRKHALTKREVWLSEKYHIECALKAKVIEEPKLTKEQRAELSTKLRNFGMENLS